MADADAPAKRPGYVLRVLIALDQLLNALFGGDEDETMSSRLAKDRLRGRTIGCVLCAILDAIDRDHCARSLERDRGKRPGQYDSPADPA